ncbi:MAG: hypothetical protein M1822_009788 [Bathelium mastoideum]|nr:MAG: hypothetical protein M1822_009788 [Bathelium mastoideum]
MISFLDTALVLSGLAGLSAAIPYSEYILAPPSRLLVPVSTKFVNGSVTNPKALLSSNSSSASAEFQGKSGVTYDFGKNIEGIVSFTVDGIQGGDDQYIGVTFTESSLWISANSCDATADAGLDDPLWFPLNGSGTYTALPQYRRGAFRYLSITHPNSTGSVSISQAPVNMTAQPAAGIDGLRNYTGYFHSDQENLNRVYYAGAWTNQLCSIDPTAGDALVHLGVINSTERLNYTVSWYNNYTIANGTETLTDGAKRDRLVWPGDQAVAVPSIFVSTNDLNAVRNALTSLYILQNSSGAMPYAGTPFGQITGAFSFTYHLYSLIGLHNYYIYSGDFAYLNARWGQFKLALDYSLSFIDTSGLQNVTTSADWLRFGMGGHNIEANSILYYTIQLGLDLSTVVNDTSSNANWTAYAAGIKSAANARLWDSAAGLYRDNETTALHPQDGNCWAVLSGLVANNSQTASISSGLAARWGKYGAPAPEAGATVSPFISSFELQVHILANQPQLAIDLINFMWAEFMLDDPRMTNSTFIEGYSTDGSLHYAPYTNDARVSHAHGWATGPTSTLAMYIAGLQLVAAQGATWRMAPRPANLTSVEAGFATGLGQFSATLSRFNGTAASVGAVGVAGATKGFTYDFEAPVGTSGSLSIYEEGCEGTVVLRKMGGEGWQSGSFAVANGSAEIEDLSGGLWHALLTCS